MRSLKEALIKKHTSSSVFVPVTKMDSEDLVDFISNKYHNMLKTISSPYPFMVYHIDNIDALCTHVDEFIACDYTDADKYRESTSLVGVADERSLIIIDAFMHCIHHVDGREYDWDVEAEMDDIIYDTIRQLAKKYKSLNIMNLDKSKFIDSGGDSVKFITIPFLLPKDDQDNIDGVLGNIKEFLMDLMNQCISKFKRNKNIKKLIF